MSERELGAVRPAIFTRAELDHLIATRQKPTLAPDLTPGNGTETEMHRLLREDHEARIKELAERQYQLRHGLMNFHGLADKRDRARSDFQRSR